ncbi:MAG: UDP-N-acetylglucosamine 1-carboxyvinyltransferase [Desulfobacteraceae bacterium]
MDKIEIVGGKRLTGEISISGAKNAALPLLASTLLAEGKSVISNIPDLADIESMLALLSDLGADYLFENGRIDIDTSCINKTVAEYDLVRKMRASILVLGPLVAKFGHARVSLPGGCAIGARPVDMHLRALETLGASIRIEHGYIEATADRLIGDEIYFDTPTVTGTENILMAACLARGRTVLRNAAREPEIVALADALSGMGVKISGAGTSIITVEGSKDLAPLDVAVIPDRVETGTFMVAAACTSGHLAIKGCRPDHIGGVISKLRQTGTGVTVEGDTITVEGTDRIKSVDIKTLPYPGFPTDMQAQFMVLMSIADGNSVIHETIFENRLLHANELMRMGADISISQGSYAVVKGVDKLQGAPVMASDLRASASLIIAGLIAEGKTVINRVYHIDRGYEAIEKKLAKIGADIKRVP